MRNLFGSIRKNIYLCRQNTRHNMKDNNIQFGEKIVGDIQGEFYIPSYQRGYRWDENQVLALLNDIYDNGEKPYCLQPLVVKENAPGKYEVIDGQQRLTTIYIIYKYMNNRWPEYIDKANFSLVYQTRHENSEFFNNIEDENLSESNIDFHFIHKAFKTVEKWFLSPKDIKPLHVAGALSKYFEKYVKVIWYELKEATGADAIALFTRLNIGRIPLTNAELVKALFLCRHNANGVQLHLSEEKQQEIALQWDTIERELHDEDFWYFLTNKRPNSYPTRIELLFDFMANDQTDVHDKYATFFFFSNKREGDLQKLWEEIIQYYYRLKEWYKKDILYHKIGYLVASKFTTIDVLMRETKDLKKSEMEDMLDKDIKDSINCKKPYEELSYENDYDAITRILLLFNVVSLMKNNGGARFPFKEFNKQDSNKWSLEHIHAQNSLKLNTQEKWKEWLGYHIDSVKGMSGDDNAEDVLQLLAEIDEARKNENLTEDKFTELSDRITRLLSEDNGSVDYLHSLSNMALLQASANSALSNGLFDAKRRTIVKMDAQGLYIPYCTKMVFLKYYTSERQNKVSFHFWSTEDRRFYIEKMNEVLHDYLKEEIRYDNISK